MAEQRQMDEHAHATDTTRTTLRRRGLIAGAATLIAGALAARTAQPVGATHQSEDVGLGLTNPSSGTTGTTTVINAAVSANMGLVVTNGFTGGTDGLANGVGGYANTAFTSGVFGRNNSTNGYGVWGEAPNGTAVFGHSVAGYGITGTSTSSYGALGQSTNSHGTVGISNASGAIGVYGVSNAAGGYGVVGTGAVTGAYAAAFNGTVNVAGTILSTGASNHSIVGYGVGSGYAGVVGWANAASAIGVYGTTNGATGTLAGYFIGKTLVQGDFAVTGSKSAALAHPDGSHRLVYCVEAPESWLEDFGTGTLAGGKVTIALDPDFAVLIDTKEYHVFLSEYEDHNALFVANRTASGFVVHAKGAATASGTFSYRIVAHRKDTPGGRLAKVELPDKGKVAAVPQAPKIAIKGAIGGTP